MSTDFGFPSSQRSNRYPKIFFYQQNDPIPIFVEASSILNRPKLMRTIRESGATIVHNPADAYIILVDSKTNPGVQFIRDWGSDPAKFVLEYTWAAESIKSERALLQNDNWGGLIAEDDGREIGKDDEGESISKSPLPTPRPTPSDTGRSSGKRDRSQSAHSKPESRRASRDFANMHVDPSPQRPASRAQREPSQTMQPPSQHQQISPPQQFPMSQQFPGTQQYPSTQQFQPSPSQQHIFQPQLYQQSNQPQQPFDAQFPSSQSPLHNGAMQFANPLQPHMQQYAQSQPPPGMQFSPQMPLYNYPSVPNGQSMDPKIMMGMVMDLMARNSNQMNYQIAMGQGMPLSQMANHTMTQPYQSNDTPLSWHEQSMSSQIPDSLRENGDAVNDELAASASTSSPSPHRAVRLSRDQSLPISASSPPLPPSMSTPSPPPPKRSKGKEKARTSRRDYKRKRSPSHVKNSDGESDTSPPKDIVLNSQVISSKPPGKIFTTDSGDPLLFYTQVDLLSRSGVVTSIKKNGGKMTGNITEAHYVILGNSNSKTFVDLLSQTIAANKLPLRSAFVAACVKRGGLLEQDGFILEEAMVKKRGRPSSDAIKTETPKPKKKERKLVTPKPITPKKAVKDATRVGPPSPSPPPQESRVEMAGGRGHYLFTSEEDMYFQNYAKFLVERDHLISNTAIYKKVRDKMPHHSIQSWTQHVNTKLPQVLESIRKKAGIARRKASDTESSATVSQLAATENEAGPSTKRPKLNSPSGDSMQVVEPITDIGGQKIEEQDFETICKFFASGGGEDSDDDQVWATLAAQQPCKSAPSWPEFFQSRELAIVNEIDRLVQGSSIAEGGGQVKEGESQMKA